MADNNKGLIVASIVGGVAVLGIGGYLIYKAAQPKQTTDPTLALLALQKQAQQGGNYGQVYTGGSTQQQQQPVIIQQQPSEGVQYATLGLDLFKTIWGSKKSKTDNSTVFVDDTSSNTTSDTTAYNDMGYGELPAGGGVLASPSYGSSLDYGSLWGSNSYGV
jgi:hypothetical protein